MNKVVNPFKHFFTNIILGLFMLATVFCAVPVFESFFKPNEEVQAASKTFTIIPYIYNDSLGIEACGKQGWSLTDWTEYYTYLSGGGHAIHFSTTKNFSRSKDNALYPGKKFTVDIGKGLYSILENASDNNVKILGYFKSSAFTADTVLDWGASFWPDGGTPSTVFCLIARTNKPVTNLQTTSYVDVDGKKWESTYGGTLSLSKETLQMGDSFTFKVPTEDGFTFDGLYMTNQQGNLAESDLKSGNYYNIFLSNVGKLQLYRNSADYYSFNQKNVTIRGYFKRNSDNDKIKYDSSSKKVLFNISTSDDLKKLANEIEKSDINNVSGLNYKVKLLSNITYSKGYMIGTPNKPFKGEFDGNGKKITATIDPSNHYVYEKTYDSVFNTTGYVARCLDTTKFLGMFGATDGAEIYDFKLNFSVTSATNRDILGFPALSNTATLNKQVAASQIYIGTGDNYIGGLVGKTASSTFNDIIITNCSLDVYMDFTDGFDANLYLGTVAAYSYNSKYTNVNVINSTIKVSDNEWDVSVLPGSYYIGGFAGYVSMSSWDNYSDVSNCNVEEISIGTNDRFPKHDNGDSNATKFCSGAFIGYTNNALIYNCHVEVDSKVGYVIYPTETIYLSGFVGYAFNTEINKCISSSYVYVDFNDHGGGLNLFSDEIAIGGLIGAAGTSITNTGGGIECYNSSYFGNAIEINNTRACALSLGGLIGKVTFAGTLNIAYFKIVGCSVNAVDLIVNNDNQYTYVGTLVGRFHGGFLVSAPKISNCYTSYINLESNNANNSIDYNFIGNSCLFDLGDLLNGVLSWVDIEIKPCLAKAVFSNNYMICDYGITKSVNGNYGQDCNGNAGINSAYNIYWTTTPSKATVSNTLFEQLLDSSNNTHEYAYNIEINEDIGEFKSSNPSAPFATSVAEDTIVVIINNLTNIALEDIGAHDGYHLQDGSKIYGSAVENYYGIDKDFRLPSLKKNGMECIGYSKTRGSIQVDYAVGASIFGDELGNGSHVLNLYPVFGKSLTVYASSDVRTANTKYEDRDNKIEYQIIEKTNPVVVNTSSWIYPYKYTIACKASSTSNSIGTVLPSNIMQHFFLNTLSNNIHVAITDDPVLTTLKIKKVETLNSDSPGTYKDSTLLEGGAPTNATSYNYENSYYATMFQNISLYYGILQEDGTAKYTSSPVSLTRYFLRNPNKTTSRALNFSISNLSAEKQAFFGDLKDGDEIVYKSTGKFSSGNGSFAGLGVYTSTNSSSNTINTSDTNFSYALHYYQIGVQINYHIDNGGIYTQVTRPEEDQTSLIMNGKKNNTADINLLTYQEVLYNMGYTSIPLNTAFAGWSIGTSDKMIVDFATNVTFTGVQDGAIVMDLYPIFVDGYNREASGDPNLTILKYSQDEQYFLVDSPEDLIDIIYKVNIAGENNINIAIGADLNMSGYTNIMPIGLSPNRAYNGIFDGFWYNIENLNIVGRARVTAYNGSSYTLAQETYVGLFGFMGANDFAGKIDLINAQISAEDFNTVYIGGFSGYVQGTREIKYVLVEGALKSNRTNKTYLGGVVGYARDTVKVSQCVSKIGITYSSSGLLPTAEFGGIVGCAYNNRCQISDCFDLSPKSSNSTISSEFYGILGSYKVYNDAVITNCYSLNNKVRYKLINNSDYDSDNNNLGNAISNTAYLNQFYSKVSKSIWNKNNEINIQNSLAYPYLKNTGISLITYNININDYVFTQQDTENFSSCLISSDNLRYYLNKQYFILDTYTFDNIENLTFGDNISFTTLEGYGLISINSKPDYTGDKYSKKETNSIELQKLFRKSVGEYYLEFIPALMLAKYIYNNQEIDYEIITFPRNRADYYTLKDFTNEDLEVFYGKEIIGYKVYSMLGDVNNEEKYYFENEKIYEPGSQVLIAEYGHNSYEGTVFIEILAEDIQYQLQFFESENLITDINNADGDDYFYIFDGLYLSEISYPNELIKTGYTFDGWEYINKSGILTRFVDHGVTIDKMPELQKEPYSAQKATSGNNAEKYILQLIPSFVPNTYTISYVTIDEDNNKTILTTQDVSYDSIVNLYDETEIPTDYGYVIKSLTFNSPTLVNSENESIHNTNLFKLDSNILYNYVGNIEILVEFERAMFTVTISSNKSIDNFDIYYSVFNIDKLELSENLKPEVVGNNYVFTAPYMYDIFIHITLNNAVRVNKLTIDDIIKYYLVDDFVTYNNSLQLLQNSYFAVTGNIEVEYDLSVIELKNEEDLEIVNGEALIYSKEDLFTYAEIVGSGDSSKQINAKLMNNINLDGFKFNMHRFLNTIDGQGYAINGFTTYNNYAELMQQDNSFITINEGTIKNLNFDNIAVSLIKYNNNFALIGENNGTIDNVYVLGGQVEINLNRKNINTNKNIYIGSLVAINNGILNNVENKASIKVVCGLKDDVEVFVGGLVGYAQVGNITKAINSGNIETQSTKILFTGGICGGIGLSNIDNVINRANIQGINAQALGYLKFIINGDTSSISIKNVVNFGQINSTKTTLSVIIAKDIILSNINTFTHLEKSKILNLIGINNYDYLQELIEQYLENSAFLTVYEYDYMDVTNKKATLVIPDVNIQIINVETKLNSNTNQDGIVSKVNNVGISFDNKFNVALNLNNKLSFRTENYLKENELKQFRITVFKNNQNVTDCFNGVENQNIQVETISKETSLIFEYEAKDSELGYMFELVEGSNFNAEEIELIKESLTLKVNGNLREVEFVQSEFNDNMYLGVFTAVKFNDNITIDINLPTIAKLDESLGLRKNRVTIVGSTNTATFSLSETINRTYFDETFNNSDYRLLLQAYINRAAIEIVYDLKIEDLYTSEQNKIEFNNEFVALNSSAIKNIDNSLLSYIIEPIIIDGNYIYNTPSIVEPKIFTYEDNGKNYKFKGFVDLSDNQKLYYDENLNCLVNTLNTSKTLSAVWEAVEYTIKVSNENGESYFSNLNGFTRTNNGAEIKIKFAENIKLPTINKANYASSFIFNGYKLEEINDYITTNNFEQDFTIFEEYAVLNTIYTDIAAIANNKVISIVPDYSEVVYKINLYSNNQNDGYETYLTHLNNVDKLDSVTYELTLSDILNKNYILPLGHKAHHDFISFKLQNEEEYLIYRNDIFEYNEEIFILNIDKKINENISFIDNKYYYNDSKNFDAVYEIHKMNVTIHNIDYNTNEILDYSIEELNDLENVTYTINEDKTITAQVPYNSKNLELPTLNLTNLDYRANGYVYTTNNIDFTKYQLSYIYTDYTLDIYLICDYRIKYLTKNGVIVNNNYIDKYNLIQNSFGYEFYLQLNEELSLPLAEDIYLEGRTLIGFKENGQDITSYIATKPTSIEFMYEGNAYTITLNSNGAIFPETITYNEYIDSYEKINDTTAEIKVIYNTSTNNVKTGLPSLSKQGYQFKGFNFNESHNQYYITNDGTATAVFERNIYQIEIYNGNILEKRIQKLVNETINDTYYPSNIQEGLTYLGLSLNAVNFEPFTMPTVMPELEKAYHQTTVNGNVYTLKVYAYFVSNLFVTIEGKTNSKILNTTNLTDFTGGENFNVSASFKITADNIINDNLILPIPVTQGNLNFATFIGYSTYISGNKELVVNENGILLDNFVYKENITLYQEFEYNQYNFNVMAEYSTIENNYGFEETLNGLTKSITFGQEIGNLPVLSYDGYEFIGYYIGTTTDSIFDNDIQAYKLTNELGEILDDNYKILNEIYFENNQFITIVAKYNYEYVNVTIKSSNLNLGRVAEIISTSNISISNSLLEDGSGYVALVPKGTNILIEAIEYSNIATFVDFSLNNLANISDENSIITTILNVTEDLEIIANFDYVEFAITYIIDGEELQLTPNSYNVESEINLPTYNREGYTFVGWYLEELFVNKRENFEKGSYGDITFYGKLIADEINITIYFDNISGYTNSQDIKVAYNSIFTDLIVAPNIDGYNFIGYFTKENKQGVKVDNESLCVFTEDVNLYAYYEKILNNTLKGLGTEEDPYQINNYEDYKVFASLLSLEVYNNSKIYYKLTNSIKLTDEIIINQFNANLDGNGFVIYANNAVNGYNYLTSNGEIIKNVSLFAENNGSISNLIFVNQIDNLANVENVTKINFANISSLSNGNISDILIYFNVNIESSAEIVLNTVANNVAGVFTNCYCYNSKITLNTIDTLYSDDVTLLKHSNNYIEPEFIDNYYLITSKEELSYLLTLNTSSVNAKLMNNIDMKGLIFDKINYELNLFGNGYVISNLILLNSEYLFDNINAYEIGFENLVFINLNNISDLIVKNKGLEKVYIQSDVNNLNNVITTNNGKIKNSYFKVNANYLINTNNSAVENVYAINSNLVNVELGTSTNFVKFDLTSENLQTNVDEFITLVDDTIWFKDINLIMDKNILPSLIKVGNYVYKFIYDENIISLATYPQMLQNNLVITKTAENLYVSYGLNNTNYSLTKVTLNENEISFDNNILLTQNTTTNYNEIEFIVEINRYIVNYKINLDYAGSIEINGVEYTEFTLEVDSGTTIEAMVKVLNGYRFISWSDGNTELSRQDVITSDLELIANFEGLNSYTLDLSDEKVIVEEINSEWNLIDGKYIIYLGINENIADYMPKLNKIEHVYTSYLAQSQNGKDFIVTPQFEVDYKTVTLEFDSNFATVNIIPLQDYSNNYPELLVLNQINNNEYQVINGYEIKLIITPKGTYLTSLLVNNIDVIDDYSIYENNDNEILFDLTVTSDLEIIINMEEISYKTTFEYDDELLNLDLLNLTLDENNSIYVKKGEQINFNISVIDEFKELDKFEIIDSEGNIIEQEISFDEFNNYFSYAVLNNNVIVKILTKIKTHTINVFVGIGGEVTTNIAIEELENNEYNNAFTFEVVYNEEFTIFINPNDGYQIDKVYSISNETTSDLSIDYMHTFKNVKKDMDIYIEFKEIDTWLTLNENNEPIYFLLQEFKGMGTRQSPYLISNYMDLLTIAYNINILNADYSNTYFKAIRRDMTFNFSEHYFSPIENFNGTLIGDNLTLNGIKILTGTNIGIFKTIGTNGLIKAVNIYGEIIGSGLIGSICGTNNGTLIGINNFANLTSIMSLDLSNSSIGGICAINNGTISRSYNNGTINSNSLLTGGICAINNANISNVYNEGLIASDFAYENNQYIAGLIAENNGAIEFAYNNSRVITRVSNINLNIYGTSYNNSGTSNDVYYNSDNLSIAKDTCRKTYAELINAENEIYTSWDFEKIWHFEEGYLSTPKLNICYDYLGSIQFIIEFGAGFENKEKLLLIDVTNNIDKNYCLAVEGNNSTILNRLSEGTYTISLTSLLGTNIEIVDNLNSIILDETKGEIIKVKILISKTTTNGYYGSIIL